MIDPTQMSRYARDLPPLDTTVAQLVDLVFQDGAELDEVVDLVRHDGHLVVQLLRLANSPAYGRGEHISSVRTAVVRVGFGQVAMLALTAELSPRLRVGLAPYGLDEGELWRHSVAAALAAGAMVEQAPDEDGCLVFAAALLHDVGKALLALHMDERQRRTLAVALQDGDTPCHEAERRVLGTDHAAVGASVAEAWGLPEALVEAIGAHHVPGEGADALVRLVHTADLVARALGIGSGTAGRDIEGVLESAGQLAVSHAAFAEVCDHTEQRLPELETVYGA